MPTGRRKHKLGTAVAQGENSHNFRIVGRLWVEREGETVLSFARVTLLQRIEELGSITAAAKSMDLSYTKAWRMIKEMNQATGEQLVITRSGGKQGWICRSD